MLRRLLSSCILIVFSSVSVFAHHTVPGRSRLMATVRIPEKVLADGKPLAPGTYEVVITSEHPALENGTPSENQRFVEFVQDRKVVAREVAEVFAGAGRDAVGTSGSVSDGAVVQKLREGDFVRVAITDAGARYLIHLPTGQAYAAR